MHWQHLITTPAENITTTSSSISAPNPAAPSFLTRPADITVALGEPAVFRCGVPEASSNITFTFYGSHRNYSLTCPHGHVEDIPQVRWSPPLSTLFLAVDFPFFFFCLLPWSRASACNYGGAVSSARFRYYTETFWIVLCLPCLSPQALDGSCATEGGESVAVWTIKGTSYSDNGTRVVCQRSNSPDTLAAILHVYGKNDERVILPNPFKRDLLTTPKLQKRLSFRLIFTGLLLLTSDRGELGRAGEGKGEGRAPVQKTLTRQQLNRKRVLIKQSWWKRFTNWDVTKPKRSELKENVSRGNTMQKTQMRGRQEKTVGEINLNKHETTTMTITGDTGKLWLWRTMEGGGKT